jgi:outer membrane protein assembly factor BamB
MPPRYEFFWPCLTGLLVSFLLFFPLFQVLSTPVNHERFQERRPGQDNLPPGGRPAHGKAAIGEFFERFEASTTSDLSDLSAPSAPSEMTGSWPGFRGPEAANISRESVPLLRTFGPEIPPVMWRLPVGEGHAAPAIFQGRVFLLDYLEKEKADALRCFSLFSGKELWRRSYRIDLKRNHGYSRTIPAVSEKHVVTIGPLGQVMCVEMATGKLLWTLDLVERYQTVIPQWYSGQCPFLDGNTVILAPGGEKTLLVGVEADTGRILWETPNPGGWKMSHSSVVPMVHRGHRMYVYAAVGGIAGIAAAGEAQGQVVWQIGDWGATVIAPSPVIVGNGVVFQSAGYGAGSVLVELHGDGPLFQATIRHRLSPREGLATEQQSAVLFRNRLFGVLPKDAGSRRMRLTACDPLDPTRFVFPGSNDLRFGLGPILVADERIFALADDGDLSMLEWENESLVRTGHAKVLPGVDAWGPPAIADGLMVLRDSTALVCLDLTRDARWSKGGSSRD